MFRICAIFGLLLFFIGVGVFGWVLVERKKEQVFVQKQCNLINAELTKIGQPTITETEVYAFADVIQNKSLQQELAEHHRHKEITELLFSISMSLIVLGGTIFAIWLIIKTVRLINKCYRYFRKLHARIFGQNRVGLEEKSADRAIDINDSQQTQKRRKHKKNSEVLENSGWYNCKAKDAKEIAELYCDQKSLQAKEQMPQAKVQGENAKNSEEMAMRPFEKLAQNIRKTILSDYRENTLKLEDSLRNQRASLEKQINEVKEITEIAKKAAKEQANPVNGSLEEITQQISAIREYASSQQDKIKKIQEESDWRIIRTFCLRVIRCIDNIEKRIEAWSQENKDATALSEIRDELIFTLESSSVEQFEPELNTEYSGLEKLAEVIKERQQTEDPEMKGKIAKVIRPGYQYLLDDKNIKIVRAALVKLFG